MKIAAETLRMKIAPAMAIPMIAPVERPLCGFWVGVWVVIGAIIETGVVVKIVALRPTVLLFAGF